MLALSDILALMLFKSGTSMSFRRQKTRDFVKPMTSPSLKQWCMEPGLVEVRLEPTSLALGSMLWEGHTHTVRLRQ